MDFADRSTRCSRMSVSGSFSLALSYSCRRVRSDATEEEGGRPNAWPLRWVLGSEQHVFGAPICRAISSRHHYGILSVCSRARRAGNFSAVYFYRCLGVIFGASISGASSLRSINSGMKWGLVIASRAKRKFRRLPSGDRNAINTAFSEMCDNPFSGDVKSLGGSDGFRRRGRQRDGQLNGRGRWKTAPHPPTYRMMPVGRGGGIAERTSPMTSSE